MVNYLPSPKPALSLSLLLQQQMHQSVPVPPISPCVSLSIMLLSPLGFLLDLGSQYSVDLSFQIYQVPVLFPHTHFQQPQSKHHQERVEGCFDCPI